MFILDLLFIRIASTTNDTRIIIISISSSATCPCLALKASAPAPDMEAYILY